MNDKQLLKDEKNARGNLNRTINKIKSDFSFKKIKNVGDFLRSQGYEDDYIRNTLHYRDDELAKPITSFNEIKERCRDLEIALDVEWNLRKNGITHDDTGGTTTEPANYGITSDGRLSILPSCQSFIDTEEQERNKDYGLPHSEKEKAFLFWFQKRDTKKLLDGIIIHDRKAQLLIAEAGRGKTFILGALIRRLLDRNFHIGKTISPWPYVYITKASVVEQTKRVLEKQFGIDTIKECYVTNYDQLRASFGELFIKETTIVQNNEEHINLDWRPMVNPCFFAVDESQSAKNEGSQQAKIITAIHKIKTPVYTVFSSATPFTRISESKYLVLNARVDYKLY